MLIIDIHDFRGEETSNSATADTVANWSSTTVYSYGDEAVQGDYVYYSATDRNLNITPSTDALRWVVKRGVNKFNMYDVYPDTYTQHTGGNLTLEYSVTNVDTIFLGNIHGAKVTVTAGATYVKNIDTTSISPLQVWGVNALKEMDDYYLEVPPFTGTLRIVIDKAPSDNNSSLGFINYGERVSLGCTLIDAIKYNVRSGVNVSSKGVNQDRIRSQSYEEMVLPIRIDKGVDTKNILKTLAKYRGIPLLVIGDDLGIRIETIFHGVYTDIEASIAEWNKYDLTLRSLSYSAFVQPTKLEEIKDETTFANEQDLDLDPLTYPVEKGLLGGVPQLSEFNPQTRLIYDEADPCSIYYKDTSVTPNVVKKCGQETEDKAAAGSTAQAKNGVPILSDFDNGALAIFNPNDCKMYYNNGGIVTACEPKVTAMNGVPPSSAFDTGTDIIFNVNDPCRPYYKESGTVKQCPAPSVVSWGAYTGTPPSSAFTGGLEYIADRSNPCDVYYKDGGGTVTKCSSSTSSGGGGDLVVFANETSSVVLGSGDSGSVLTSASNNAILVGSGTFTCVETSFGGMVYVTDSTGLTALSDGDSYTVTSGCLIRFLNADMLVA